MSSRSLGSEAERPPGFTYGVAKGRHSRRQGQAVLHCEEILI